MKIELILLLPLPRVVSESNLSTHKSPAIVPSLTTGGSMAERAGLYHNVTTLVTDTEVRLAFDSEQIVRINLDFPWTTVNLAAFVLNCLTVLTVNAVVLVWLKMKENTLVDRMVLLDCLANISIIGVMFLAFPTRVWGSSLLCLPITFFRSFVLVLNRWPLDVLFLLVLKIQFNECKCKIQYEFE